MTAAAASASAVVVIVTNDEQSFSVPTEIACMSDTLKSLIRDLGETRVPIPLPLVTGPVFRRVMDYLVFHHEHRRPPELCAAAAEHQSGTDASAMPARSAPMSSVQDEFNARFIAVDCDALLEMIAAANYLDIKSLLHLSCKEVAMRIKGKKPEEIRQMLRIVNDFTPEEEAMPRPENEWSEEAVYGTKTVPAENAERKTSSSNELSCATTSASTSSRSSPQSIVSDADDKDYS